MPLINEQGNTYHKLTVLSRAENDHIGARWLCKCDCGNTSIVRGSSLRNGKTKSCGCLQKESMKIYGDQIRKYPKEDRFRNYKLMHKYGITESQYLKMLDDQDGKCLICESTSEDQGRALAVDHCHKTGVIRGLLCQKCNTGIGQFNDDVKLLADAIRYLQEKQ